MNSTIAFIFAAAFGLSSAVANEAGHETTTDATHEMSQEVTKEKVKMDKPGGGHKVKRSKKTVEKTAPVEKTAE